MHLITVIALKERKLLDLKYLAKLACDAFQIDYLLRIAELEVEIKQLKASYNAT